MPSSPSISVIIPCYNVEAYLQRAVSSVLAQTIAPIETILVDDGSTDGTTAMAKELAAKHPNMIRYVHQANRGLSGARNTGIREARGEWVALLDADDWWTPDKLAKQVAQISADPQPDLVYTALMIYPEDAPPEAAFVRWQPLSTISEGLRWTNRMTPSSVMFRRSLVDRAGYFNENIQGSEDWEFWARLVFQHKIRVATVSEPVTCYRLGANNMSVAVDNMIRAETRTLPALVADLTGLEAACWRLRIWSAIYYRACLNARLGGDRRELGFALRSVFIWPSPFFFPKRFTALAVTLRRLLLPDSAPPAA
jgi:glycosyltransferase involved in cell wall biosynthesis